MNEIKVTPAKEQVSSAYKASRGIVGAAIAVILVIGGVEGGKAVFGPDKEPLPPPPRTVVHTEQVFQTNEVLVLDMTDKDGNYFIYPPAEPTKDLDEYKLDKILFRKIGKCETFRMGSPKTEIGRYSQTHKNLDFEPERLASIDREYYIAVFETTQRQYEIPTGEPHGNKFVQPDRAKDFVSWLDITNFLEIVNSRLPKSCPYYVSLPTEEQWEHAARVDETIAYPFAATNIVIRDDRIAENLDKYGAYLNGADDAKAVMNDPKRFPPVGAFLPTAYGLYDIHGGVWEWCENEWRPWLDGKPQEDLENEPLKTVRGGGYWFNADDCRSANRHGYHFKHRDHGFGFRLVLNLK